MSMSQKAKVFCGYFNTCRANLDGMESFLDKNFSKFSVEDKGAIAKQMGSGNVKLPLDTDSKERWELMVDTITGTQRVTDSVNPNPNPFGLN